MRLSLIALILSLVSFSTWSQGLKPKGSFQTHVGLPINMANEPFKGFMQGLVAVNTHYQHSLENGLSFGIGLGYHYFAINEFKLKEPATGGVHSPNVWGYIGYEKIHSKTFGTDIGLRGGYSYNLFQSDLNAALGQNPRAIPSTYFEPTFGMILFGEDLMAFKFTVGYMFQGIGFRPSFLGIDSNLGYDPARFNEIIRNMTFSFGYVHYFRMH